MACADYSTHVMDIPEARTVIAPLARVTLRTSLVSLSFLLTFLRAIGAQTGGLQEVEFSRLSQNDPNPLGTQALAINPQEWKHSETEHFIYHFVHGYVATPVATEAEFYYRVVVKELEREPPGGDTKSHIYIFERPEDWQQFQSAGRLEPWTGGIHSQGSLFIVRNPSYKFSDNSLGHEITHLVMHRFYPDGIPRWLDEGWAEYISKNAHASYQRARGYLAKPRSALVSPEAVFPLAAFVTMGYPAAPDAVSAFYTQSERLVRFLVGKDKASFLGLLDAQARHQPFEPTVLRLYSGKFASLASLEEQFRTYATGPASAENSAD